MKWLMELGGETSDSLDRMIRFFVFQEEVYIIKVEVSALDPELKAKLRALIVSTGYPKSDEERY